MTTAVQSTAIRAISYDESSQGMQVHFTNGNVYHYYNISPELHQAFLAAPSKGKFFGAVISKRPHSRQK